MDHLQWHDNKYFPRPPVPFLCADSLNDIPEGLEDFEVWPSKQNWSIEDSSIEESAKQIQAWLFFGLIRILCHEVGEQFNAGDYVSRHDVSRIDSTKVSDLLQKDLLWTKWFDKARLGTIKNEDTLKASREISTRGIKVCDVLTNAWRNGMGFLVCFAEQFDGAYPVDDPWSLPVYNAVWSGILLFDRICELIKIKLSSPVMQLDQTRMLVKLTCMCDPVLRRGLLRCGRCPSSAHNAVPIWSSLEYFRTMASPLPRVFNHAACSESDCQVLGSARTKHSQDCNQPFFAVLGGRRYVSTTLAYKLGFVQLCLFNVCVLWFGAWNIVGPWLNIICFIAMFGMLSWMVALRLALSYSDWFMVVISECVHPKWRSKWKY